MHYGVRGCCDRGMTGCLFFAGFLFSSGKYQAPNQGGSSPGPYWDRAPTTIGGFTVNTKKWPHMDNLLLAIFNFHYENMRRQNKGLSNVNLWLSSSWLVLSFLALSLPPSVPDMACSQPLPFPTAHPHPAHYSPGVTLHPTRLKSLIKSTSPESPPASDECGGPENGSALRERRQLSGAACTLCGAGPNHRKT